MKEFKKITLSNGLRVLLIPQQSLAATVLVLVEAGSEYEAREINGLSHFLEHMVFKGTSSRPRPGMIALELDSLGAEYNAFTGQEYTGYWAKARNRNASQLLELMADMYLNPVFNPQEIEKERGVIIEEINLEEDTPSRKVHHLFNELLYGDQPAGWDIAGNKEIVRRLQREDFVSYRSKHYIAPATVVAIAGDFDQEKVLRQIKKYFGGLPKEPKVKKPKTVSSQKRPATLLRYKKSDQSHLVVGVHTFDAFDKRRYALKLLSAILGGGMSSRLWHRIREELGAAYYVHSFADLLMDHGSFAVGAGVDHRKIEPVLKAILTEFSSMRTSLVGAPELAKAKEHYIGNLVLGLETSDELASFYGGQEILRGEVRAVKDVVKSIKAVTAQDVRAVARAVLSEKGLNLAVIGPYKSDRSLAKLLTISN